MHKVRVRFICDCQDATMELYRDIHVPFVFPGLEMANLFRYEDEGMTDNIDKVEYDHATGMITARLGRADFAGPCFPHVTLDYIRTCGIYDGWVIEWYGPKDGTDDVEGPISIGAASSG